MKRTVVTKQIDDFEIVIGFDKALIDPMATKNKVLSILKEGTELKEIENTYQEIQQLQENIVESQTAQNQSLRDTLQLKIDKLSELQKVYNEKVANLFVSELVYFEPKKGETIIDSVEYGMFIEKFENLKVNNKLTRKGKIVEDYRGLVFWQLIDKKWQRERITKLNEKIPDNAVLESELTDEIRFEIEHQRKIDWILGLTDKEQIAEKEKEINLLLSKAALKRSQLEIQGVDSKTALAESQAWFNEEKSKVERLYDAG